MFVRDRWTFTSSLKVFWESDIVFQKIDWSLSTDGCKVTCPRASQECRVRYRANLLRCKCKPSHSTGFCRGRSLIQGLTTETHLAKASQSALLHRFAVLYRLLRMLWTVSPCVIMWQPALLTTKTSTCAHMPKGPKEAQGTAHPEHLITALISVCMCVCLWK